MSKKVIDKRALLPKYFKSPHELKKQVQPGNKVSIKTRLLNFKTGLYELQDKDYTVEEAAVNCLIVREKPTGIPWFAIHDWEIVDF